MTPDKQRKIEQAKHYVEMRLREFDGPNPGQSAVLVINVRPAMDDPEAGFVMVGCLPDMDHKAIIAGLESWIADLKAGQITPIPHGLDEDLTGTVQ